MRGMEVELTLDDLWREAVLGRREGFDAFLQAVPDVAAEDGDDVE